MDLLDIIEEYGLDLQNIKHASTLSGCLLVAMHLTADVFLIGLMIRWGRNLWKRYREARERKLQESTDPTKVFARKEKAERLIRVLEWAKGCCLALCLMLFLGCAFFQEWRGVDWALWPLDSMLRLVDVGDLMQVFHWRLHGVAGSVWLSTLAVSLRLFAGFYLAELLTLAQLKVLREWSIQTIEQLAENLTSKSPATRKAAAEALGGLKQRGVQAVAALVRALADKDEGVREAAAEALGEIGPRAASAVPALVSALADKNWSVREAAEEALGKIDANWTKSAQAASAVPALVSALADKDEDVRKALAETLGKIGPRAASVVPALVSALADKEWDVRKAAARALGKIDSNWANNPQAALAISILVSTCASDATRLPTQVLEALKNVSADWATHPQVLLAVPWFAVALCRGDETVRGAVARALRRSVARSSNLWPTL